MELNTYDQWHTFLSSHNQEHVLAHWGELSESSRQHLMDQLREIDFEQLSSLIQDKDETIDFGELARRATLPRAVATDGSGADWTLEQARQRGEAALRAGEIATVLVAGGQGTRLGFDQPKGMFPVGPVSGRTLFEFFADRLIATQHQYGAAIPLYLMTSEATDEPTREYFEKNNYLGLTREHVAIFKQGTMPAVDASSGQLLLAYKGSLALSPDGHGGTLRALHRNGCLEAMRQAGQKHLFYFQVDNPLVGLCDPVFIGHHLLANSEMTTQVIRKRYATEKVGNVVEVDGRTQIIEYSDLPDEAAAMTDADGNLKLWAGNIAVHLFDLDFLERMQASSTSLPFHRASKKVSCLAADGNPVSPKTPNATKFERFIFDLLPQAERTIVCEVEPKESFAPVKNADGAETDTPDLAKQAICNLHKAWLESQGARVADSVKVEINPRFALEPDGLSEKISANLSVDSDRYFDQRVD